jgi:hypothetical protein
MAKIWLNIPIFLFNYFLLPEKTSKLAGLARANACRGATVDSKSSDESPYKFKCRDLVEIIGKLGEYFLRVFSVNYAGIRASMP